MIKEERPVAIVMLGMVGVEVHVTDTQLTSHFQTAPDGRLRSRVTISIKPDCWPEVVGSMLHEFLELSFVLYYARYGRHGYRDQTSEYVFMFDHGVLTEAVDDAAGALCDAEGPVRKAWRASLKRRGLKERD